MLFHFSWLASNFVFMAEKLRNLGKFTFADIAAYRLAQKRLELWLHLVLYLLLFYI